jgi:polyisoprenoid-binding protein YceI
MKNALQGIGIVALLAWTGLGALAWSRAREGVEVVIQEAGSADSGELALLADRVELLSTDLDRLVESLSGNFEMLAEALESGTQSEMTRSALLEQRLTQLEAALPHALHARETAGALDRALARLETLDGSTAPPGRTVLEQPTGEPASPVPSGREASGLEDGSAPVTPEAVAPKRSFLAFQIPSRDFQFEGRQRFEILGELSRVGFDAKSTLHDFTGISNQVSGSFRVDLADPGSGIEGAIRVATSSLNSGLDGRDEAMLEHLDATKFSELLFEPTRFSADVLSADTQVVEGTITGMLTLRGSTREVAMQVKAHVDDSRRLVIEGEMPLVLDDYQIPVPSKLGVISMEKQVRVWINLRARARAQEQGR